MKQSFGSIPPLFRGPFLEKVAHGSHASMLVELGYHFADFSPPSLSCPLGEWFDFFYSLLFSRYRCEYIYKNAITTKLFLSRHSLQDSYITDELRSAGSRADVAILNGTSTIYEIKSQYDSFDRLESQLADYSRIFDRIYIVTTEARVDVAGRQSALPIGIIALREDGSLKVIREAVSNKRNTDPSTVFDCMRRVEYCGALVEAFGCLPQVPNSQLYRLGKEMFRSLDPAIAHDLMVRHVKLRGKKTPFVELINNAPFSLKHACLNFNRSRAMATTITERLTQPLI